MQARVQEYEIVEEIGPVKGFFYVIKRIDCEDLVDVDSMMKVFCVPFSEIECSVIKLCTSFDHSYSFIEVQILETDRIFILNFIFL